MKKKIFISIALFCCTFLYAQTLIIDQIDCFIGEDGFSKLKIAYNYDKQYYTYQYDDGSAIYEISEVDFFEYIKKAVEWKKVAIDNSASVQTKEIGSTSKLTYVVSQGNKFWANINGNSYAYLHNSSLSCCIKFSFSSTNGNPVILFMEDVGSGFMYYKLSKDSGSYGTKFPTLAFINDDIDKFYNALSLEARQNALKKYTEQQNEKNKDADLFQ